VFENVLKKTFQSVLLEPLEGPGIAADNALRVLARNPVDIGVNRAVCGLNAHRDTLIESIFIEIQSLQCRRRDIKKDAARNFTFVVGTLFTDRRKGGLPDSPD
jgi:hypothetical protein